MYSMKRSVWPVPRKCEAISRIECSFSPRLITAFTFTGSPAAAAASIPSSTRCTGKSTSFIARNVSSSSESRLTVTRSRPAAASAAAFGARSDAFVVSVSSAPSGASRAISRSTSFRTSGSPPVSRSLLTPRPTKTRATARDLLEREQLLAVEEAVVAPEDLLRHAVDAAEVAAVGDRDAEVAERSAEAVQGHGPERSDVPPCCLEIRFLQPAGSSPTTVAAA